MSDTIRTYDETFYVEIEGLDQLQADLDSLADSIRERVAFDMVTEAGNAIAEWMRENIRMTFWRHPTGSLENSVFATAMTNEEGAACYIGPGGNGYDIPYAAIHEYGGDIYPGELGYLRFQIDGQWITISRNPSPGHKDHVTIPARPYIAPSVEYHTEEILEIMQEVLYAAIAADAADI